LIRTDQLPITSSEHHGGSFCGLPDRRDNGATGLVERTTQQSFNDDGTLAERKATGTGLSEHRSVFGYDADGNTTSVNTYKDGSATPNVSELVAGYTSAG
jgi:hypothetical protein